MSNIRPYQLRLRSTRNTRRRLKSPVCLLRATGEVRPSRVLFCLAPVCYAWLVGFSRNSLVSIDNTRGTFKHFGEHTQSGRAFFAPPPQAPTDEIRGGEQHARTSGSDLVALMWCCKGATYWRARHWICIRRGSQWSTWGTHYRRALWWSRWAQHRWQLHHGLELEGWRNRIPGGDVVGVLDISYYTCLRNRLSVINCRQHAAWLEK